MPTTSPKFLTKFPNHWSLTAAGKPLSPISEARTLQRLIFSTAQKKDTTPVALAALARAWTCLQTSIREMRGIPLPGQLRPDSLSGKSAKRGKLIELAEAPAEAPEQPSAPANEPTAKDARAEVTTKETPTAEGDDSKESTLPG